MQLRTVSFERRRECRGCGAGELALRTEDDHLCDARAAQGGAQAPTITPAELVLRRTRGEPFELIDVREPAEWEIGRIEGARLAPLSRLAETLRSMDPRRAVVVYCASGIRSARAARELRAAGFGLVWSLAGGIARWREEIDPTIAEC
jgi:adenylyltransferase/sulfurtransferase